MIKRLILHIGKGLLGAIFFFMKLAPQDSDRIVFLSRESDRPSVDFTLLEEQLKKDMPNAKIVMLTRRFATDEGGKIGAALSYGMYMLKQMHHVARARAVILDTYNPAVSLFKQRKSLLVMQLWHAMGNMKRFGYALLDKGEGSGADVARIMRMHKGYDYILISSKSFIDDYSAGFGLSEDERTKIIELPLPKADLLTDADHAAHAREAFLKSHGLLNGKKKILYCPTFRKENDRTADAVSALSHAADLSKYDIIVKLHPLSRVDDLPNGVTAVGGSAFDAIFAADYVISDYSTIIYEAGLAGKPLLCYSYDFESYEQVRELNFDIAAEFPGPFSSDAGEIMRAIENDDFDMARQREFIERNVHMPTGMSCTQALSRFIIDHLK